MCKKDRIELLREALRSRILIDLAKQTGLSYSCLAAIRDGRTKWPRLKTMNLVLPILGLDLEVTHGS